MKAFVIEEAFKVSEIHVPEPKIGPDDVLLDVHYLGLCGSDLNSYKGLMPLVTFPRIPGHEISGVIIEKGYNVPKSINIGDNATVLPYTNCGICPACRQGKVNTCEFNQTLGVQRDGALTERIAVPYDKVFVSKTLSLKELALIEPMSVGYHGANRGVVSEIDTVMILGCGTIGMGALCAAVRKGATVIGVDIDDTKLSQARKFGAQYTINSAKENVKEAIHKLTNNEGVSVAIEAAGTPITFTMAIDCVCFAGRVVTIGYSKSDVGLNTQLIVRKELNLFGSRNALRVFPSVIAMFEKKTMPFTDMITKIFPFNETPNAFNYWAENTGTVSKILIDVKA
jgi:threonine dehydrogenase-like Zn-dependent dehydrogenase